MTILVLCVDPESGIYVAFCAEDPLVHSEAHGGCHAEAVGNLMISHPGLTVANVVNLDELWGKK